LGFEYRRVESSTRKRNKLPGTRQRKI
jgi:hypothetical protein